MIINFVILIIALVIINFIFKSNNIFLENPNKDHKKFINNNNLPISGGLFLFLAIVVFTEFSLEFKAFILMIFLVGLLSDLEIIDSPILRLFLQIIIVTSYILYSDNLITDIRIDKLNLILQNYEFVSIIFTIFCFVILINGTNFMDGINSFVGTYYFFVFFIVNIFFLNDQILNYLLLSLIIFILFNGFGKSILGDSGSYLISFIAGSFLIKFSESDILISPYFIVLLLWYPAYENLFSIIRKKILKRKAFEPDNDHLHQLIYFQFKKITRYANTLTGIVLSLTNFIIFFFAKEFYSSTTTLVTMIFVNVIIYNITYFYLYKKKY